MNQLQSDIFCECHIDFFRRESNVISVGQTWWNLNCSVPVASQAGNYNLSQQLHWSTKILAQEENVSFWCIYGRWIQICNQNFSITHTLCSRLNGWSLLRHQEDVVVFRSDVCSFMEVLGREFNQGYWRLFIDSSKVSLTLFLLDNENKYPSVSLAHAVNMKEICESMKLLLGNIKYDELKWRSRGDLKVVALFLEYNSSTQNIAVSCARRTVGQEESLCK